ncbi:MAG: sigma-54 dependent transcriptional regulator [Candidatus Rokuibacteriota bacterium]
MKPALLVADDDPVARDLLVEVLEREGYRVRAAGGGEECLRLAAEEVFDLALVDLRMPDLDGLAVLKRLPAVQPELPVLILTAFATMDSAVEAIGVGACDYLSKPFRMDEIRLVVRRTLAAQQLIREHRGYRQELRDRYRVENFVGQSPDVVAIYKLVARVARLDTTVLITGETGTGKELVARAIHYASHRAERAFVVVDCTALPETLFESELFGHERGAFTGAAAARRGLFETASGGTCLLDEIGELSPALQAKLLRVLQERAIRRLGGNDLIPVDLRIIAATNRNLKKLVEDGGFREDLYYRLHVVAIAVPPLRERAADIPLLVRHFLEKYARASERPVPLVSPETMGLLTAYAWPGNVRELEHALERAVALGPSPLLLPDDLPPEVRSAGADPTASKSPLTLEEMKRWYVAKVIRDCGGNKVRAAEVLGVDRRTLYRILEREGEGGEAGP